MSNICKIIVLNDAYVLAPQRGLIDLLESRETTVSDSYRELGEGLVREISEGPRRSPARRFMLYSGKSLTRMFMFI